MDFSRTYITFHLHIVFLRPFVVFLSLDISFCAGGNDNLHVYSLLTTVISYYCAPSGLSELRPARRISSVERRLTAITELQNMLVKVVKHERMEVLTKNAASAS